MIKIQPYSKQAHWEISSRPGFVPNVFHFTSQRNIQTVAPLLAASEAAIFLSCFPGHEATLKGLELPFPTLFQFFPKVPLQRILQKRYM